jgi:hypothetical protein
MQSVNHIVPLKQAYEDFRQCILSVPDDLFLSPLNGWSPREVMAHLIGWNDYMITASRAIILGETPSYYADFPNDYKNINAEFVARYASQDKAVLLDELALSFKRFTKYVESLEPGDVGADHGVLHYRGGPATVACIIQSLAGDYEHHRQEIELWLETTRHQPGG